MIKELQKNENFLFFCCLVFPPVLSFNAYDIIAYKEIYISNSQHNIVRTDLISYKICATATIMNQIFK